MKNEGAEPDWSTVYQHLSGVICLLLGVPDTGSECLLEYINQRRLHSE